MEAMGIEPTNLLHAMQALYQLSYAPRRRHQRSSPPVPPMAPCRRAGRRRAGLLACPPVDPESAGSRGLHSGLMAFKGWPVEALEFYEGLEADNSKVYWTEHKDTYTTAVHGPMAALLSDLADEFGEGRIFRPYRDVRFSADKSPYKTSIAADSRPRLRAAVRRRASRRDRASTTWPPTSWSATGGPWPATPPGPPSKQTITDLTDAGIDVHGTRPPQDRTQGLPAGPPPGRAPALPGPGRHEAVAGGRLARHQRGQDPDRRRIPGRPTPVRVARRECRRLDHGTTARAISLPPSGASTMAAPSRP